MARFGSDSEETCPHPTRLDHDEGLRQTRPESGHDLQDAGREFRALRRPEAHEDHTYPLPSTRAYKLPEVLVLGEKDALMFEGQSHDAFVGRPSGDLGYGHDVVTLGPERADNCEIATLVGQELQSRLRL